MTVSSIAELERQIKKNIDAALLDDVGKEARDTLAKYAQSLVYDAYHPVEYERRHTLDDPMFYTSTLKSDNVLFVDSNTPSNNSVVSGYITSPPALSHWIQFGEIPNIFNGHTYIWEESRPFVTMACTALRSGLAVEALKNGMRKRGFQVV